MVHRILLICLLFIFTPCYADQSDEQIAQWTSDVLTKTLSVNYIGLEQQTPRYDVIKYYAPNAWSGFRTFLGNKASIIIDEKLTIHPQPTTQAKVVDKGAVGMIQYWRVNQNFYIPELGRYLYFSVIVIKPEGSPLRIESLNIEKKI